MIAITSPEQFKKAAARVQSLNVTVEMLKLGDYIVWGQGGDYHVKFAKVNGQFSGECNCKAGKRKLTCWHLYSGYEYHRELVNQRQLIRRLQANLQPSIADWMIEPAVA